MPAYISVLPEVFPYVIRVPAHSVENIVKMLYAGGNGRPNGSSFAITSDAPSGYRTIWLSEASYQTLKAAHIVPGLYPVTGDDPEAADDNDLKSGRNPHVESFPDKSMYGIRPHKDISAEDLARMKAEAERHCNG